MPRTNFGTHKFSEIPRAEIQRSAFDRSHDVKTTFNFGDLIPVFRDDILPGDTVRMNASCVVRAGTLVRPIMSNLYLEWFFFFIPMRLLWDNWPRFMGERLATETYDPDDYSIPTFGTMSGVSFAEDSLHDYLGLPPGVNNLDGVSSMYARAYALTYNEWFRDQNLIDPITVDTDDGPDVHTQYSIQKRGKRKDYFTSCLPWPQKGVAVELPLGTKAAIHTDNALGTDLAIYSTNTSAWQVMNFGGGTFLEPVSGGSVTSSNQMYADLSTATASTINQIREAFQIQRLYERDARGGTRYTELILSHFGVTSPDARLQRPEFLGGGRTVIQVNQVAANSDSANSWAGETKAQGDMAAFAYGGDTGIGFTQSFSEHGILLGLVSGRADISYQEGIHRDFLRSTRWDFFWPALAHLGEQAVTNAEIYAQGTSADDDVFGYQERYAEYRYKPSLITGQMRSQHSTSTDVWHTAQEFGSLPTLNQTFIEETPPISRLLAAGSTTHEIIMDAWFEYKHVRPMPTYSVPGLVDHF